MRGAGLHLLETFLSGVNLYVIGFMRTKGERRTARVSSSPARKWQDAEHLSNETKVNQDWNERVTAGPTPAHASMSLWGQAPGIWILLNSSVGCNVQSGKKTAYLVFIHSQEDLLQPWINSW